VVIVPHRPLHSAQTSSSIHDILRNDSKQLQAKLNLDPGSARIEVQCLLQAVLQVNRAWLLSHPEQPLADAQHEHYLALFERRLSGEPIAYLLGKREFYGLTFKVSPATLIPRPETELLVELALQRIPPPPPQPSDATPSHSTRSPKNGNQVAGYPAGGRGSKFRVLDLGTGSGAIALSVAHARPDAEVVAVDASVAALEVAQFNMQRFGLGNVHFLHSDWFSALQRERFDMIVANPPYIAADDAHLAQGDVRFEPRTALVSGTDGLDDIRRITAQAKVHLNNDGWLLFEHGYGQAAQVRTLLQQAGLTGVFSECDLAGIERVSGGSWSA
jgi:release factor glutamine methyltransferase